MFCVYRQDNKQTVLRQESASSKNQSLISSSFTGLVLLELRLVTKKHIPQQRKVPCTKYVIMKMNNSFAETPP